MSSKREVWVDYIKVFACVLVVLGHFFQSMVKAGILPENDLYTWFNTTIYYFHVPLFFICSGYLYQRYSVVNSWLSWKTNVIKKAVVLGIPYFVFSLATWLLKSVFAGSVNTEIGGLGYTLFIHPTAPYWYMYILFLIFLLTPTVKSVRSAVALTALALIGKTAKIIGGGVRHITDLCSIKLHIKLDLVCAWHDARFHWSRNNEEARTRRSTLYCFYCSQCCGV